MCTAICVVLQRIVFRQQHTIRLWLSVLRLGVVFCRAALLMPTLRTDAGHVVDSLKLVCLILSILSLALAIAVWSIVKMLLTSLPQSVSQFIARSWQQGVEVWCGNVVIGMRVIGESTALAGILYLCIFFSTLALFLSLCFSELRVFEVTSQKSSLWAFGKTCFAILFRAAQVACRVIFGLFQLDCSKEITRQKNKSIVGAPKWSCSYFELKVLWIQSIPAMGLKANSIQVSCRNTLLRENTYPAKRWR